MQPYDCGQDAESNYFPGSACISSSINVILMCVKKKKEREEERGQKEKIKQNNTEKVAQKISLGVLKRKKWQTESAKKADPCEIASVMQIN